MRIIVDKDNVKVLNKPMLHKGEYGIHKCEFEFSDEYKDLVKVAVFHHLDDYDTYKIDLVNDVCDIPNEVLRRIGDFTIGVYAYVLDGEALLLRYSPKKDILSVDKGSYSDNGKTPTEITPSQYEMYSQALNDGLKELNGVTEDVAYAKEIADQLIKDKESGALNGKDGEQGPMGPEGPAGKDGLSAYEVYLKNGGTLSETEWLDSLKGASGKDGIDGKDGAVGPQGPQGERGPQGEKGEQGATGQSGVYVGTEEPTDENVNVWINPNGESTVELINRSDVEQMINEAIGTSLGGNY